MPFFPRFSAGSSPSAPAPGTKESGPLPRRAGHLPVLLLIAVACALPAMGYLYLGHLSADTMEQARKELTLITELKTRQVTEWRQERLRNGAFIHGAPFVARNVRDFLQRPEDRAPREELLQWFALLRESFDYTEVIFFDRELKARLAIPPYAGNLPPSTHDLLAEAMARNTVILTDLHPRRTTGVPHLDLAIPVPSPVPGEGPLGAINLIIEPHSFIYPVLQFWPTPSPSGEILLLRRDGDDVLYLNELRHRPDTALNLKLPVARKDFPAGQAILGATGLLEGKDYRGIPVLAVARAVPGTTWVLLAKRDRDEVFAELRTKVGTTGAVVLALILATAALLGLLARGRESRLLEQALDAERERVRSAERFRQLLLAANEPIFIMDGDWRILDANQQAVATYGHTLEELRGMHLADLYAEKERTDFARSTAEQGEIGAVVKSVHLRKDGSSLPVETSLRRLSFDGQVFAFAIVRDLTEREWMLRELRASEERLRVAIDATRLGLFDLDFRTGKALVNREYAMMLGEAEAPAATDLAEWRLRVHPEDLERMERTIAELAAGEREDHTSTYRLRTRSGAWVWVLSSGKVVERDASGKAVRLLGTHLDITAMKQTEERLRLSQRSLDRADNIVTWAEPDGTLFYVNQVAAATVGLTPQEVEGCKAWEFPAGLTAATWESFWNLVKVQGTVVRDVRVSALGRREKRIFHVSSWLLRAADRDLLVSVGTDVTAQRRTDFMVRQLNEELSGRLQDLAVAMRELERSNRDLEQFAYIVSHDLQEPLRMISSFIQLIERRAGDRFAGETREFMDYVVQGASRMQGMVDDLLEFSRVGTRGRPFSPVAMEGILEEVEKDLRLAVEDSGAVITHDSLPVVAADASQMARLLQNLLANALKFRGEAPPRVHVSAERQGDEWIFAIRDNGIGIDPKDAERIFVIFQRLHSSEKFPGTGIGLAVCRRIVERHGGRIWVESAPGAGATFFFSLPVHQEAKGETA